MSNAKKPLKNKRAKKYDEKLAVSGSFLDVVKAAAKNANKKKDILSPKIESIKQNK